MKPSGALTVLVMGFLGFNLKSWGHGGAEHVSI
jgi:hypothetical protein